MGLHKVQEHGINKLTLIVLCFGFLKNLVDCNVYIICHEFFFVILCLYVNDCILAKNDRSFLTTTKVELSNEFDMAGNGCIGYSLGIQVYQNSKKGEIYLF